MMGPKQPDGAIHISEIARAELRAKWNDKRVHIDGARGPIVGFASPLRLGRYSNPLSWRRP